MTDRPLTIAEIHFSRCYRCTVAIRRGPGWPVKPEAEAIDGLTRVFQASWVIGTDDHSLYVGEWAMLIEPSQDWPRDAPHWIATGDLVVHEEVERP